VENGNLVAMIRVQGICRDRHFIAMVGNWIQAWPRTNSKWGNLQFLTLAEVLEK